MEEVFRNTLKRKFGTDDNFDIIINPDKGDLEIWRNRVVVEDGQVEDENEESPHGFSEPRAMFAGPSGQAQKCSKRLEGTWLRQKIYPKQKISERVRG